MIALKLKLIIVFFCANLILNKDHDIKVLYDPIITSKWIFVFVQIQSMSYIRHTFWSHLPFLILMVFNQKYIYFPTQQVLLKLVSIKNNRKKHTVTAKLVSSLI